MPFSRSASFQSDDLTITCIFGDKLPRPKSPELQRSASESTVEIPRHLFLSSRSLYQYVLTELPHQQLQMLYPRQS